MGARVLATDVHVWREDKAAFITLPADTVVPDWATDLVTNPKAFKEVEENDAPAGDDTPATSYAEMKNDELKALLKKRELPTSGKHDELVARLNEDDAERADEDDAPSGDDAPAGDDTEEE
ncbi:SAP domain-containing protein [Herbiconiux sp. UC225_62]|uniref:SAP domain-containing protein n=1 Tax=Herbiconiux sp. UC225_62 TaxID=3350168 RepID=UPI0036D3839F